MPKHSTTSGLRGSTRPLAVRLRDAEDRAELLKKRLEVQEGKKEIKQLKTKIFGRR